MELILLQLGVLAWYSYYYQSIKVCWIGFQIWILILIIDNLHIIWCLFSTITYHLYFSVVQ